MTDLWRNPLGTAGFEFIEFASDDAKGLGTLLERLGFAAVARHRSKDVLLYRQGSINFLLNAEPGSQAARFVQRNGPGVNAIAVRVENAARALQELAGGGARLVEFATGAMELNIPAVETAAGILLYLVDRDAEQSIYEVDFNPLPDDASRSPEVGLECIDHLTFHTAQNDVHSITQLFEHLFNFKEIYYPSYSARDTSPGYRALTSPCGEIRIRFQQPPAADKSTAQPARQSRLGIQHIALRSQDICHSVEALRSRDVPFVDSPEPSLPTRLDRLHRACGDIDRLRQNRIRIQAGPMYEYGRDDAVLRISTGCLIGPLYFEVIQRSCVDG